VVQSVAFPGVVALKGPLQMMQHTELELFEAAPLLLPFVVQKDNPAKLKAVLGLEVLGPPVILAPEKGWPVAGVRALQ